MIFLGTLEFRGEFYEIEFYNSIQVFTTFYGFVEKCLEKFLGVEVNMGCEYVNVLFGGGSWGISKKFVLWELMKKVLKDNFQKNSFC